MISELTLDLKMIIKTTQQHHIPRSFSFPGRHIHREQRPEQRVRVRQQYKDLGRQERQQEREEAAHRGANAYVGEGATRREDGTPCSLVHG